MKLSEAPRTPDAPLEELLRSALSTAGDGFDTAELLHTTHRRVTQQRRRHAVATVAATGVAAVALVTVWQAGVPLNESPELVQTASQPSPAADDPAEEPAGDPMAMTAEDGSGREADQVAPWQAHTPPLTQEEQDLGTTEGVVDPPHGAWQIPDPRPTGVAFLDELGDPQGHSTGTNMAPVEGMVGNDGAQDGGLEPVAGQAWAYWLDDSDYAPGTAYIHITGWEDAGAAMEGLRDNELYFSWGEDHRAGTWPDRENDPDRFALATYDLDGASASSVVVRTGDYLVAVTAMSDTPETSEAAAREIADKTAENLTALDPEHGGG